MKSIYSLVPDIQKLVTRKDGWFDEDLSRRLGLDIGTRLRMSFGERSQKPTLRLSGMGPRCPRALWYSIHHPELAEPLPPWAEVKFAFGHILEALAVELARAAGHDVKGEQDELVLDGIKGHRDAVIDGCIVDFKSCSQRAFDKLKTRAIKQDDSFGYLDQLDGYLVASADDPLVTVKDKAYLFGIDKTLGHMVLYEHEIRTLHIRRRVASYKKIVDLDVPPRCTCGTIPDGASGNIKLDVRASYDPFKYCCFPTLRTFLYAKGPVYLSTVVRVPDVPEITRYNRLVEKVG